MPMVAEVDSSFPAWEGTYETREDGKVQCNLCPRRCALSEGQRGMCFVRAREGDAVVLKTYGRSSGFCVDPIEKKPLNHFLPGTPVLSFGTAGCNLTCRYCQNWSISRSREWDTLADEASPAEIAGKAVELECRSIAYTYNDPVIFAEYAVDTALAARPRGLKSVAVTAGFISEAPRNRFFASVDAANIDLKSFSEQTYRRLSTADLQTVQDTLVHVAHHTDCWLEVTTLLIPGVNDSEEELTAECAWIREALGPDVPLHFSAFHPDYKMRDLPPTPHSTLSRARAVALEMGLRYVYTGNVYDPEGQSTYCHECGDRLIGRDGYELSTWHLDAKGRCRECGTRCAGLFEERPGRWGSRRLPVRMHDARGPA